MRKCQQSTCVSEGGNSHGQSEKKLNFTSALYLGIKHDSKTLKKFTQLTTGTPAALGLPPGSRATAYRLANLIGCDDGVLGSSTFQLFWDLFQLLARKRTSFLIDSESYPIAQWAVQCAAGRHTPVHRFSHHDVRDLQRVLEWSHLNDRTPIVLTDGLCPECGRVAPIREYLKLIRQGGGKLVLDDTQAIGILGKNPSSVMPYGFGGGGVLKFSGVRGADIISVGSLAKAFGAPVAVLAGNNEFIQHFKRSSKTAVHCSPPSVVAIGAAKQALSINEDHGDELRYCLKNQVELFQISLRDTCLKAVDTLFPVQTLAHIPELDMYAVYKRLLRGNVHTILKRSHWGLGPQLALLITADHNPAQVDAVIAAISSTIDKILNRRAYRRSKTCTFKISSRR